MTPPHDPDSSSLSLPPAARSLPAPAAPSWWRRTFSALYEGVLLFGVLFIADYLFDTLTQSRNALMFRGARMFWLFLVLGAYFAWFWTHGGQTLAMKTWRIRLVDSGGGPLAPARAVLRYLVCWLVILPGPALVTLAPLPVAAMALLDILILVLISMWVVVDPDRQALYDRLIGTRLIDERARR